MGNSYRSMEFDWVKEYRCSLVDEYEIIKSHLFNLHIKDFEHKMARINYQFWGMGISLIKKYLNK